ncbi:hypothetical protein [Xanthomonas phage JGB6]|nr:hypothetical protein [Xanthomonas phage JGB6]
MNKYLIGSPFKVSLVSDGVPAGAASLIGWSLRRLSPVDTDNTYTVTDSSVATGLEHSIPLSVDIAAGVRAVWQLSYSITDIDGGTHLFQEEPFILEASETLIKGNNSFQSYFEAMLVAEEISGMDSFKSSNKEDQIAALSTAYRTIGTMTFQDKLGPHYDVTAYDAAKLDKLELGLLKALCIAQVIEANELLDTNSIHYKRMDGLLSETIGESSMMFKSGSVTSMAVTRRSLMFLRNYILLVARLARA